MPRCYPGHLPMSTSTSTHGKPPMGDDRLFLGVYDADGEAEVLTETGVTKQSSGMRTGATRTWGSHP